MVRSNAWEGSVENRPLGIWAALAIVIAVGILSVRAVETSVDLVAFGRILVSAIALATFFIARRHSFSKGLLLALAIETTAGVTLFTLVDLPFLRAHWADVNRTTATILFGLERASALSVRGPETLAQK